jgi:hypothetical protein
VSTNADNASVNEHGNTELRNMATPGTRQGVKQSVKQGVKSKGLRIGFTGADAHDAAEGGHEYLAVADAAVISFIRNSRDLRAAAAAIREVGRV